MAGADHEVTRRTLVAGGASLVAGAALAPVPAKARARRRPVPALGAGGNPTELSKLHRIAQEVGRGEPVMIVDLGAVDQNIAVVLAFAKANGFAVRPALKVFGCVPLATYIVQRLPEARGLLFHLGELDAYVRRLPPGTDLLTGYPPTPGELRAYLASPAPRGQRRHRLRILIDSVPLLEELARLAHSTRRPLPIDVALELDSGEGRGGFDDAAELHEAVVLLRRERERLRLGALLCYDGHATLTGVAAYRKLVATTAQARYRSFLDQLAGEAADLYDGATLIRNGPASANMHNWAGTDEANEISPGSAFVYPRYLGAYDHEGLAPALFQCAPVLRVTSDYPSVPLLQTTLPGSTREEIIVKGGAWPSSGGVQPSAVYPNDIQTDDLSGGGSAITAPKGSLRLGDYVLYHPDQGEQGVAYFGVLHAVRNGRVVRVWETLPRWGTALARR